MVELPACFIGPATTSDSPASIQAVGQGVQREHHQQLVLPSERPRWRKQPGGGWNTGASTMYPNPNRGDQLFLSMSNVEEGVNVVNVDIFDMTGKNVMARTIAVQDGPAETVFDLDFDKDGFLWISTGNGLCRYDGVNLDVLRNEPRDTASLPHNPVGSCLLLPDGRLLAGTQAGLAVVDTREMTVARIAAPIAWSKGSCTEIGGLTLDTKGRVWVCDRELGLLRFHPETNSVERIYPSAAMPGPHERPNVHAAVVDADGSLWVIDLDHLLHIDPERSQMEAFRYVDVEPALAPKPMLTRLQAVPSDPNLLVIGSWGSGIITFDKRTRSFSTVKRDTGKSWNVSNIVLAITAIDEM